MTDDRCRMSGTRARPTSDLRHPLSDLIPRRSMALQPDLDLIRSLEEELFKQTVRGSPEAVSMLLADNFIEFGRSGGVYRKDEVVRNLAAETHEMNAPKRTATDFELTSLSDDVVLLSYRSVRRPRLRQHCASARPLA